MLRRLFIVINPRLSPGDSSFETQFTPHFTANSFSAAIRVSDSSNLSGRRFTYILTRRISDLSWPIAVNPRRLSCFVSSSIHSAYTLRALSPVLSTPPTLLNRTTREISLDFTFRDTLARRRRLSRRVYLAHSRHSSEGRKADFDQREVCRAGSSAIGWLSWVNPAGPTRSDTRDAHAHNTLAHNRETVRLAAPRLAVGISPSH